MIGDIREVVYDEAARRSALPDTIERWEDALAAGEKRLTTHTDDDDRRLAEHGLELLRGDLAAMRAELAAPTVDEGDGYAAFLDRKAQPGGEDGFDPSWYPDAAFDFQRALIEWSCRKGRSAIFADCGLGKTLIQLAWAENVRRHTGGNVLILTPLAVSHQTVREAEKFGVECSRSADGSGSGILVTNYERLEKFDRARFAGVVCDESSILKSFDGATRKAVTEFMRPARYRLLCTATAAPNDHIELGTSSEALGYLGYIDMLGRFFKNDEQSLKAKRSLQRKEYDTKWRFKGHAESAFWRWVGSWARAVRKPSDLGFDDSRFVLPPMTEEQHIVKDAKPRDGMLFPMPAVGLAEQREERRRTLGERCRMVADLVAHDRPALVWCGLNDEGDELARIIPDSVQVSGSDSDDEKEARFNAFLDGSARVLVTKPKIGAWGLNFQHCSHVTFFPSHSFEQYYQGVRRCWRFGQTRPVKVDIVTSAGEAQVMANLQRKAAQAADQFDNLVRSMRNELAINRATNHTNETRPPSWL